MPRYMAFGPRSEGVIAPMTPPALFWPSPSKEVPVPTDLEFKLQPKDGETIAYDEHWLGWRAVAFYREGPDARIVIARGDTLIREFDYPAYRIWNIAAHLPGMVDGYEF